MSDLNTNTAGSTGPVPNLLNSEEGKAAVMAAAKELGFYGKDDIGKFVEAEIMKRTEGLGIDGALRKKRELEGKLADPKLKAAKEAQSALESLLSKIGAKDYNEAETLFDKILHPDEPDDVRELKRNYSKLKSEYEKTQNEQNELKSNLETYRQFEERTLKSDKLRAGLVDMGCNKIQADALALYLQGKAQFEIIDRNGNREAVVKDSNLTIDEYLSAWATTEEAKQVLPARPSTGGGATGSNTGKGRPYSVDEAVKLDSLDARLKAYADQGYKPRR